MSRFTQYFGLTEEAIEFLKDATLITHFEGTTGIAMEPVYFGIWKIGDGTYAEVLQAESWSSGPMIFTCLVDLRNPDRRLFEWSEDKMLRS